MEHNQINCVIRVGYDNTAKVSHTIIRFGHDSVLKWASGLTVFVGSNQASGSHNVELTNVTFEDNYAYNGNFYLILDTHITFGEIYATLWNVSVIQNKEFSPGLVIEYYVDQKFIVSDRPFPKIILPVISEDRPNEPRIIPVTQNVLFDDRATIPSNILEPILTQNKLKAFIVIKNSYLKGSCVILKELPSFKVVTLEIKFFIIMEMIVISEARCSPALLFNYTDIGYLITRNLTITSSYGDIMYATGNSDLAMKMKFTGYTYITANKGSILFTNVKITFAGHTQVSNNIASTHESTFLVSDSSEIIFSGETSFRSNIGRQGGAISVHASNVLINGSVRFTGNTADGMGGAISLKEGAMIKIKPTDGQIEFTENKANEYGGAIFVEDVGLWISKTSFIRCFTESLNPLNLLEHESTSIKFTNNSAGLAGNALYGGWIDICKLQGPVNLFQYFEFSAETDVSSNPSRICMCTNSILNTNDTVTYIETFPGQTFEIQAVAVGQRFGVVPAIVRAKFVTTDFNTIDELQRLQDVGKQCTTLKYTIHSRRKSETMVLLIDKKYVPNPYPGRNFTTLELQQFKVNIIMKNCPLGFEFNAKHNVCKCHHILTNHDVQCNISLERVNRKARQWIATTETQEIIFHKQCPFDYCKHNDISLNLSSPDEQCAFNRSGILCGTCKPGLSQVFGTSNCKTCSNTWLLLIIPFALAGGALVLWLMFFNLTVSSGMINGLIFYANIVRANTTAFFPGQSENTFHSWFIAWLNLDLGIETCFYRGLNAYTKTWLQFVFPIYIWLIVTVIIISSHYSSRAARLFGSNCVQILATLFLLSYAKLLRNVVTILQPMQLHFANYTKTVWCYDGNISYLQKEHIPLFIVGLSFLLLFFIPYTITLFGIQWLQPFSHYKPLRWINKLKPLFDAYTGPYKDKHRYWTGLLLLVRTGIFTVIAANNSGDISINLLAVNITVLLLLGHLAFFGGIYKMWPVNVLEYFYLLNLAMLAAGTMYMVSNEKDPVPISVTSTSAAILVALPISSHYCLVRLFKTLQGNALWKEIRARVCRLLCKYERLENNDVDTCTSNGFSQPQVSSTVFDLNELHATK